MENQSDIQGKQNIVIQNVSKSTIKITVNGELFEIKKELNELKTLLQKNNTQDVQYAEKIYNIGNINEANFDHFTGKTAFNETLTKQLVEVLQNQNEKFKRLIDKNPNWGDLPGNVERVQRRIANKFVGVIGEQLGKLMAIGKEENISEDKQRRYIKKCIYLAQRSFDLICFAMLSELWEVKNNKSLQFNAQQMKVLTSYFDNSLEIGICEQFELLRVLHEIFSENELHFPILELGNQVDKVENFSRQMQKDSQLYQVCQFFRGLNKKKQIDLLDSYEAETQLAVFFKFFHFLTNYRMASIKSIGYRQIRNDEPHYLHRYTALGIETKAEKIIYTPNTVHTNSVLLYRGDNYLKNVNLSPFVIDYNALIFEEKATRICFYSSQNWDNSSLQFLSLDDNKLVELKIKGIMQQGGDLNELLLAEENHKIFNLDCVVDQFNEARQCLVGDELDNDNL